MSSDPLRDLQLWFYHQCDGDWEHSEGIIIQTLDNPGWSVEIALTGTNLEGKPFSQIVDLEPELDWVHCLVEDNKFKGFGGPKQLSTIIDHFLRWATSPAAT